MNTYREAASLLPLNLCGELLVMTESIQKNAEEIRLRTGRAVTVLSQGKEYEIASSYKLETDDLYSVLEKATYASVHSVESELAKGFVTVDGGIRIGICGTAVYKADRLGGIKDFSSMAIRIPHDIYGCSSKLYKSINADGLKNVLIISPPGFGKTTFMRDYIRNLSTDNFRVSVADERSELAAVTDGEPQFDMGPRTDVMNGVKKAEAVMMLLKAMNPDVIAMDEISEAEDISAVSAALGCGVKILATAHASGTDDLKRRKIYREMLELGLFEYAVIIKKTGGTRQYACEALL